MAGGLFLLAALDALDAERRSQVASQRLRAEKRKEAERQKKIKERESHDSYERFLMEQKLEAVALKLAEKDFEQIREKAIKENQQIDFTDPEEAKLPEVVSESDGRTIYADGSYSVSFYKKHGISSRYTKLFMPNGVMQLYVNGKFKGEELPDGSQKEYYHKEYPPMCKLEYEKDSEGNYKRYSYDRYGYLASVEDGNKDGWVKRKYAHEGNIEQELDSSGNYKLYPVEWRNNGLTYTEGNLNTGYKTYDSDGNIIEECNHQTCEFTRYNAEHKIIETGIYDRNKFSEEYLEYNGFVERSCYDENQQIKEKYTCGKNGDENGPHIVGVPEYQSIWTKYVLKSDKSGFYMSEVRYEDQHHRQQYKCFDEQGRIVSHNSTRYTYNSTWYTYYGDTNIVETEKESRGGECVSWKKYDKLGRLVEDGKDPENCLKFRYYGDTKQIEFSEQVENGEAKSVKHFNENGAEDTISYLAKERVAKRKKEKLAKLEDKPKIIQKVAGKIASARVFNDIAVRVATRKIEKGH